MSVYAQIVDAHRAGSGRLVPPPRPDVLLVGPADTAFVLRLADAALRGAPAAVRTIAWWERPLAAQAPVGDDDRELLERAARLGVPVLAPVAGACEPAYREALAAPHRLVAACGIDAAAAGAFGAAVWPVTPLEAAALMCGGHPRTPGPRTVALVLAGSLPPAAGGVDAALGFASRTDPRAWSGAVIEVDGAGVAALGIGDRIAFACILVRAGAAHVLFPSDDTTREALRGWGRDADWRELRPSGAPVAPRLELDLDALEPLVAPGADAAFARPLRHVLAHPLAGVEIGPYADEDDVAAWLAPLAGRRVAHGLTAVVAPGTAAFADALAADADALAAAGVTLGAPAGGRAAGTWLGCGAGDAGREPATWLANPLVCAASALAGGIADPRSDLDAAARPARRPRPAAARPQPPQPFAAAGGEAPRAYAEAPAPPGESLRVVVWIVVGDDWPAERVVSRSARGRREVLDDPVAGLFPGHDRAWMAQAGGGARGAIVAGRNFGGGDAADEAAWSLRRGGVALVLARSFAPGFARALALAGVLPLAVRAAAPRVAQAGEELEIPRLPEPGDTAVGVRNLTCGSQVSLVPVLDPPAIAAWRGGGVLAMVSGTGQ